MVKPYYNKNTVRNNHTQLWKGEDMAGNKIKAYRKSKNVNQTQLAMILGVSKQSVCDWEKGRSVPSHKNLRKIAEFFNITIDNLLEQEVENE